MKLLISLLLCCFFVIIQSNPLQSNRKHFVDEWKGREVLRFRKAFDYGDGDDNDHDDEIDDADEDEECYFSDMCNYYNDDYDPCELAPYDEGCEDDDDYPEDDDYK